MRVKKFGISMDKSMVDRITADVNAASSSSRSRFIADIIEEYYRRKDSRVRAEA